MAVRNGYCVVGDLLLGDMPVSSKISPEKFVADSADEIDVRIGRIYAVPVDVFEIEPTAKLTLKIINARLASGRMILAQAQAAQDETLNAYGMHLIREADTALTAIEENRLALDGADIRSDLPDVPAPTIHNQDAASPVDAFYGHFLGGGASSVIPDSPIWSPGS